jgi:integrase/recombinase XerD
LFDEFIAERRYLHNVSPKTLDWYACSRRAFQPYLAEVHSEADLAVQIRRAVMGLAAAGKLAPTSINDYSRCINAFLRWLHTERHVASPIHIAKLKTQKKLLEVLTGEQVSRLIAYSATKGLERRVHAMAMLILDTGMRVDEVLNLRKQDVDLENMLIKVQKGKGDKQRIVPCSLPLRRILYRYIKAYSHPKSEFVFSTAHGVRQTYRNAARALKVIGGKIGAPEIRFHLMRHTFATAYIRSGGNVVLLRKILGHSSISTTMIYEHLQTEDLSSVHHQHSILALSR